MDHLHLDTLPILPSHSGRACTLGHPNWPQRCSWQIYTTVARMVWYGTVWLCRVKWRHHTISGKDSPECVDFIVHKFTERETLNMDFKVTIFFLNKYVKTRQIDPYNGRLIWSCIRSTELLHIQWPSMNPDFKACNYSMFNMLERIQDRAIVSVEYQQELVCNLSNGKTFHWPWVTLTLISQSQFFSASNNWKMVKDRTILCELWNAFIRWWISPKQYQTERVTTECKQ